MPLNHPLDAIYAKLERADESIKNLEAEINQFLARDPRPYRIDKGFYGNPLKYEFRAYATTEVPLRFSVLAGEIVHQCRSCLDHLVVQLVMANGHQPTNRHQFPICRTREAFKNACRIGNVVGIKWGAFRQIAKAQPFRHPSPDDTIINVIHQLDIRDKHRLLMVVAQAAQIGQKIEVGAKAEDGAPVRIIGLGEPGPVRITNQGAEVFSISLEAPVPDFYANAEFKTQIALAEVGAGHIVPIIPALTKMMLFVRRLLTPFEKYF